MPQKLFVGNLPHEVTDSELGEFVSGAGFQAASAVVIRDKVTGQSRGFGFIELAEGEDMERAIAGLNGQSLQGRRLTVNEARPPRNDFGGGGGNRRPGGGGGGRSESLGRMPRWKPEHLNRQSKCIASELPRLGCRLNCVVNRQSTIDNSLL